MAKVLLVDTNLSSSPIYKFLVSEVLADLDGKYRAEFSKSYKKFSLSVKAPGYKELKQRLKYLDSATLSSGLVEEIYMVRENKAETKTRRTKYIQPYINQLLIYALFIISVVFLFLWLLYAVAYPGSFYGWINLAISIYAVPWNIFIISERLRPKVGRVLDLDSKRPIENVLVWVYDNKKQIFAGSTDKRGIVKLDVNSGEYSIRFSHPSYKTSFESADKLDLFKHLTVGLNGYIESNVYLEKTSRNFKQDLTSNLINPFASV